MSKNCPKEEIASRPIFKTIGFKKIKNLQEFFIYKNPANNQKEIGAKTKNGNIHEFQIKGLMMTNEFQELKQYVLNEL